MWNLAYISHDYESTLSHSDPMFSTHVRRSAQTLLDGSGVDFLKDQGPHLVGSLLRLPAPRFVYLIRQHPVLEKLPLYKAYGDAWLDLMEQRSRLCLFEDEHESDSCADDFTDLHQANTVLSRIRLSHFGES
jgi:hypothetical protein